MSDATLPSPSFDHQISHLDYHGLDMVATFAFLSGLQASLKVGLNRERLDWLINSLQTRTAMTRGTFSLSDTGSTICLSRYAEQTLTFAKVALGDVLSLGEFSKGPSGGYSSVDIEPETTFDKRVPTVNLSRPPADLIKAALENERMLSWLAEGFTFKIISSQSGFTVMVEGLKKTPGNFQLVLLDNSGKFLRILNGH